MTFKGRGFITAEIMRIAILQLTITPIAGHGFVLPAGAFMHSVPAGSKVIIRPTTDLLSYFSGAVPPLFYNESRLIQM